jgi:6-phosphogluconolactonase (cycloisomerase 2 family)
VAQPGDPPAANPAAVNPPAAAPAPAGIQDASMKIELPKPEFAAGEAVRLNVVIRNNSTEGTLFLGGSAFDLSSFRFSVKNAAGDEMPKTAFGTRLLHSPGAVFANAGIRLPPGARRRYQFAISRMFDMSRSAVYTISVERRVVTGYKKLRENRFEVETAMLSAAPVTLRINEEPTSFSGAGAPAHSVPPRQRAFLYVLNRDGERTQEHGTVVRYLIGDDGQLSPALHSLTPTGNEPWAMVVSPDNRFVYIANTGESTIGQFRIENNGLLAPLMPPTVPAGKYPSTMTLLPGGRLLHVTYHGGVATYQVNDDGTLTPPPAAASGKAELAALQPGDSRAFGGPGGMNAQRIREDGTIERLLPQPMDMAMLTAVTLAPSDHYAYVLGARPRPGQEGTPRFYDQYIIAYAVNARGELSPLPGGELSLVSKGDHSGFTQMVVEPSGHTLYVLGEGLSTIMPLQIRDDGTLAAGAPSISGDWGSIKGLVFDPTGHFAYVAKEHVNSIGQYRRTKEGELQPLGLDVYNIGHQIAAIAPIVAPVTNEAGPITGGLQLSAWMEQEVFNADMPVRLNVTLHNTTDAPVALGTLASDLVNFTIKVTDEKGQPVPLTAYGRELLQMSAIAGENRQLTLGAGQTRPYLFLLTRLYDLSRDGIYTVQVQRHLDMQQGTADVPIATANSVQFQVTEPYRLSMDYAEKLPAGYHYANGIGEPFGEPVDPKERVNVEMF